MTTDIELSYVFKEAFYFYFKQNSQRGELTFPQNIEKQSYFLSTIQNYLVKKQKQKTQSTMNELYKQWNTEQAFLRNKVIDIIRNVYVPRIDKLNTFNRYYTLFKKNLTCFLHIFSPFETTLSYFASVLNKSVITLEQLAKYEWEFSFSDEQLVKIAKREANEFPIISPYIPLFLRIIPTRQIFRDSYVKEINNQVRDMIREKWLYIQQTTTDKDKIIIKKIEFVKDMYKLFSEDLYLYKQYFKDDYDKLFKTFQKEIVLKKYNTHYELELNLLDDFFTIEWWKSNHKIIQQKWAFLATEHYSFLCNEFISIQYYRFLKKHFYYFTQNLEKEITHNEYFLFLEEILIDIFPFNTQYISQPILSIFQSCIHKFIIDYWKEHCEILFFEYLDIVRNKSIILNNHLLVLSYLLQMINEQNNINPILEKSNILFQKRVFDLFLKSSLDDNYSLQHHIEFERNLIDKISELNGSSVWFNDKSKWTKMLNEIQESDQFTNTVTMVDSSLQPCNIFIGTYGFYPNINKSYGIPKEHVLYNEWNQIKSFYPVLNEKKKLELMYNNSTAEVEIGGVSLLCSMDVVDTLIKWQQLWDEYKTVNAKTGIEKKIVDVLVSYKILECINDEIIISEKDQQINERIELLFYKEKEKIVKKQNTAHVHVFDKLQYYLVAIIRECKKKKEIDIDILWEKVQKRLQNRMLLEPKYDLFDKAIEKAIDNEYIEKKDQIVLYV